MIVTADVTPALVGTLTTTESVPTKKFRFGMYVNVPSKFTAAVPFVGVTSNEYARIFSSISVVLTVDIIAVSSFVVIL